MGGRWLARKRGDFQLVVPRPGTVCRRPGRVGSRRRIAESSGTAEFVAAAVSSAPLLFVENRKHGFHNAVELGNSV